MTALRALRIAWLSTLFVGLLFMASSAYAQPTPVSQHKTVAGLTIPFTNWTTLSSAGTILAAQTAPFRYCFCGWHLDSSDGNQVTITDSASNIIVATKTVSDLLVDRYGPCLPGAITFTGVGHVSVCWYPTMSNP